MPRFGRDPMIDRQQFLNEFMKRGANRLEVCARYKISRRTGYKWLRRFEAEGLDGLSDRSHAPHRRPHAMSDEVRELLAAARRKYPKWGPKKLLVFVRTNHPSVKLPAASSVGGFLKRAGLVQPRVRKRRIRAAAQARAHALRPNQVWCADFKGDFRLLDGRRCYPLTITDLATRKILACVALPRPTTDASQAIFQRTFRRFGLPEAIRTDNGIPFATTNGLAGLSVLNVWWLRLGIRHERIDLGRPDQNGAHERMHRTLKEEATFPPSASMAAQQRRFDRFRRVFNELRPHEALNQRTPDSQYHPSGRELPRAIIEFRYPPHMEVRTVSARGMIRIEGSEIWLSEALHHQHVGLEKVGGKQWLLHVGPHSVAEITPDLQVLTPTEALLRRAA